MEQRFKSAQRINEQTPFSKLDENIKEKKKLVFCSDFNSPLESSAQADSRKDVTFARHQK